MNLKEFIREVPNWPKEGINFKDITTILENPTAFKFTIDEMTKPFLNDGINKIVVIDARGFLLGSVMAYNLKLGISLVRKKGKLPYKTIEENYEKEYGFDVLTMHEDTIKLNEKVLIVDDLLATGGTLEATVKMIEKMGGIVAGISVIVDLPFCGGRKKLEKYKINSLVDYEHE
ncbi:MAG: adenine phosphoribosyltransferase [Patescibacteria group bacterium]